MSILQQSPEEVALAMAEDPIGWAKLFLEQRELLELQRVLLDRYKGEQETTH